MGKKPIELKGRNLSKGHSRDYQTHLLIGGKGQGKSTYLFQIVIKEYLKKYKDIYQDAGVQPRVFVHDMSSSKAFRNIPEVTHIARMIENRDSIKFDHPLDVLKLTDKDGEPYWKKGVLRYAARKTKDIKYMYEVIGDHFRNGLLVLDEWTSYVRSNPPDWQIEMINNHRNFGLEVFLVCHQILAVPPFFVRGDMVSSIILFKTGEDEITYNQVKNKYRFAKKIWDAKEILRKTPALENQRIQPHIKIEV